MNSIILAKKRAHFLSKKHGIQLKEALEEVAKENNSSSWKDYRNSLDTFWYKKSSPFLNYWFTSYLEAKTFKESNSGYLLTYKGQYFVASAEYIESLDIDPNAPVWERINYDICSSNALEKFFKYYSKEKEV